MLRVDLNRNSVYENFVFVFIHVLAQGGGFAVDRHFSVGDQLIAARRLATPHSARNLLIRIVPRQLCDLAISRKISKYVFFISTILTIFWEKIN